MTALRRTRPFQPSRLALVARCASRYLRESEAADFAPLPPGLRTLFGRAVHDIIGRGTDVGTDVRTALVERVMAALQTLDAPVPRWATRHRLPAARLVAPTALAEWVRFATVRMAGGRRSRPTGIGRASFGREIDLASPDHDLAGRPDRVDDAEDTTVVTELKSGRLRMDIGDDHRIQLLGYGLLAADRDHRRVVLEAVSPNDRRSFEFDGAARAEILSILAYARSRLPRDVDLDPDALATPGSACLGCRFRPACRAYATWAELAWRDLSVVAPLDVWGEVQRIHLRDDLAEVVIVAPDGALTRVVGFPYDEPDEPPRVGELIRFFDLESAEIALRTRRPANMLIVDHRRPAGSAWSAAIERLAPSRS